MVHVTRKTESVYGSSKDRILGNTNDRRDGLSGFPKIVNLKELH